MFYLSLITFFINSPITLKIQKTELMIIQSSSSSSPPSSYCHQFQRHPPSTSLRPAVIVCQLCHRHSLALQQSLSTIFRGMQNMEFIFMDLLVFLIERMYPLCLTWSRRSPVYKQKKKELLALMFFVFTYYFVGMTGSTHDA